ncbi:YbhB/YbcL family Raf kinase inhibitor-like protein [Fervidobacterium thailandense]|uniref:Phosphatidylethanolamine-binding protein n=1 Tax=Fervidobacterium thailandense TaxID=1008305 RepID=A0A1E3G6C2_9BACT|nr:YbhB/YbcL family Raf kinase inhibitor-like protein [Fervidobacterium thailandense]ODN31168.1 phosphatidylethanolamine-binding protein [Fervidobacterium thailandense]
MAVKRILQGFLVVLLVVTVITVPACKGRTTKGGAGMLTVKAPFENNAVMPVEYTCDGRNVSPELKISGIPSNAKSVAVICDDPDAPIGTFVHWVLWNVPVSGSEVTIPGGMPKTATLSNGARQGLNDFGRIGYDGPCPPKGHGTHHYHFKVYALDTLLNMEGNVKKKELEKAMEGHILAKGEIVGLYARK